MSAPLRFNRAQFAESYRRNPKETMDDFLEGINKGEFRLGYRCNLDDVFEGLLGVNFEHTARSGKGFAALEAADAVTVSDFRVAMSQFMLYEGNQGWNAIPSIVDELVTPRQANTADGLPPEKVLYIPIPSDNDDNTYAKVDGDDYKTVKAPTAYVEFLGPKTWGATIPVERKIALLDKSGGQVMEQIRTTNQGLKIRREKQFLSKLLGVTGTWRFGAYDKAPVTEYSHYLTSGLYTNSYANTLTDWNSFKTVWLKLLAVTDPVTGQAMTPPNEMLVVVPPALYMLAQQILKSTSVGAVDNQANSSTVRFYGPNPVSDLPMTIRVIQSQYVYLTTSSNTTWFAGDFKAAYRNCQLWPYEQMERGQESPRYFSADILYEQRFGYAELVNAYAPFRVTKNT